MTDACVSFKNLSPSACHLCFEERYNPRTSKCTVCADDVVVESCEGCQEYFMCYMCFVFAHGDCVGGDEFNEFESWKCKDCKIEDPFSRMRRMMRELRGA
jgi:hypothetical protein